MWGHFLCCSWWRMISRNRILQLRSCPHILNFPLSLRWRNISRFYHLQHPSPEPLLVSMDGGVAAMHIGWKGEQRLYSWLLGNRVLGYSYQFSERQPSSYRLKTAQNGHQFPVIQRQNADPACTISSTSGYRQPMTSQIHICRSTKFALDLNTGNPSEVIKIAVDWSLHLCRLEK